MKIEKTWESGKKSSYTIHGTTDREMVYQYGITSVFSTDDETGLIVNISSKKDAAAMARLINSVKTAEEKPTEQPRKTAARRPELVEVAERDGLNRGKGWIASDYDADRLSLNPAWVGEAICYVYE